MEVKFKTIDASAAEEAEEASGDRNCLLRKIAACWGAQTSGTLSENPTSVDGTLLSSDSFQMKQNF